MSSRDLSVAQMLTIADVLLDPAQKRPKLEALPRIAPYLDEWTALTQQLRTSQSLEGKTPEQARLQIESTDTDALHDRLLIGILDMLEALDHLSTAPVAARFTDLRTRLLPGGAMMTRASYVTEAGNAELAAARLTAEDHLLLASVTHPGGTLDQTVHAWIAAARHLGEIETRRASLSMPGPTRDEVRTLRQKWNQIARVIRAAADTEPSLTDESRQDLFGSYDREITRRHISAIESAVTPAMGMVAPVLPK